LVERTAPDEKSPQQMNRYEVEGVRVKEAALGHQFEVASNLNFS